MYRLFCTPTLPNIYNISLSIKVLPIFDVIIQFVKAAEHITLFLRAILNLIQKARIRTTDFLNLQVFKVADHRRLHFVYRCFTLRVQYSHSNSNACLKRKTNQKVGFDFVNNDAKLPLNHYLQHIMQPTEKVSIQFFIFDFNYFVRFHKTS